MLHHKLLWEPEYIFVENCGRDESTFIVDGRHKYNYKETSVMTGDEVWRCGRRPNCDATLRVSSCHKKFFLEERHVCEPINTDALIIAAKCKLLAKKNPLQSARAIATAVFREFFPYPQPVKVNMENIIRQINSSRAKLKPPAIDPTNVEFPLSFSHLPAGFGLKIIPFHTQQQNLRIVLWFSLLLPS